jgi:hypothetical protein
LTLLYLKLGQPKTKNQRNEKQTLVTPGRLT